MKRFKSAWLNWRKIVIDARELSFGAKGMALYLNTYMNDSHDMAFPSISTVCGELNLSNKTAIKYLSELASAGYLRKEKRFSNSTIYYAIIPKLIASCVDSPLMEELHHSCVDSTPTVVEDLHSNKQVNKQSNKQVRFEEFWKVWPKKERKAPAVAKWEAKKLDKHADDIIADILWRRDNYKPWHDEIYMHPVTYLNQEAWNDERDGSSRVSGNGIDWSNA